MKRSLAWSLVSRVSSSSLPIWTLTRLGLHPVERAGGRAPGGVHRLALPFFFSAAAFNAASRSFAWLKRHYVAIQALSGAVLVAMGVLVLTGELFRLNIEVQQFLERWDLNFFQSV